METPANGFEGTLPPLVRPDNREVQATQQLLDGLWEWYKTLVAVNNVVAGQPVAHGRRVRLLSVWPSEDGRFFTASIRARDKGKSEREYVLYSTAASPATAMKAVVSAACDPSTLWKEQARRPETAATGKSDGLPEIV